MSHDVAHPDPWSRWRERTRARIALGRAGASLPTRALLDFELDHARARDAVHHALNVDALDASLRVSGPSVIHVHSAAADRATYLLRPDLGRRLDDESRTRLTDAVPADVACDLAFVIADGLSAWGAQRHAAPLMAALLPLLRNRTIAPLVIARQARVALGDEVGALLRARLVVVVIGERPGLTSPDSLGLYLTFAPRVGRHDAERNCISNVRPEGLPPEAAAAKLAWLIDTAFSRALSGVDLKDESGMIAIGEQPLR